MTTTDDLAAMFAIPAGAEWMNDAQCSNCDPATFMETDGEATAKRICARCPVQAACLDWALEHDDRFGVWGGLSPRERRRLRRRT